MNKFKSFFAQFVAKETVVEGDTESTTYSITEKGKALGGFVFDTILMAIVIFFAMFFLSLAIEVAAYMVAGLLIVTYVTDTYKNLKALVFPKESSNVAAPVETATASVDEADVATA